MEKTVYTGKNEGKIMDTEVSISFNKLPFTCVLPLFMDFWKRYSVSELLNHNTRKYNTL